MEFFQEFVFGFLLFILYYVLFNLTMYLSGFDLDLVDFTPNRSYFDFSNLAERNI
jgi:hypothetical protein